MRQIGDSCGYSLALVNAGLISDFSPNFTDYRLLGLALRDVGRFPEAITALSHCLEMVEGKNSPSALHSKFSGMHSLSSTYLLSGDAQKALELNMGYLTHRFVPDVFTHVST